MGDTKLTPKDRTVQLGKDAHLAILKGLLLDTLSMNFDPGCGSGAPGQSNKALIVQLEPGEFGELGHAILDKVLEGETTRSADTPPHDLIQGHLRELRCMPPG